jgi:hypothetical protein
MNEKAQEISINVHMAQQTGQKKIVLQRDASGRIIGGTSIDS